MKKLLVLFLSCSCGLLSAQQSEIAKQGYKVFALKNEGDSIRYVVKGLEAKPAKKGLILFIQGSTPTPLFVKMEAGVAPPLPFDTKGLDENFRFVVISKPGIPVLPDKLDKNLQYTDSKTGLPPEVFLNNDNLQWNTNAADRVLKELAKQSWVDTSRIMVIGHSQGARTAAYLCTKNKLVHKLAFLSCSAFSLSYNFSSSIRATCKGTTALESAGQLQVDTLMMQFDSEMNPKAADSYYNHHPIDDLLQLNIPILMIYGLDDHQTPVETNDLLVMDFKRKGKTNLGYLALPGYDHNFFEQPDPHSAKSPDPVFHWDDIAKLVIDWMSK